MEKIFNFIGGELTPPIDGAFLDNVNPATGAVYSQVPDSKAADVKKAIEAAKKAFPAWSALSPKERSVYLTKISELITKNLDQLAMAETVDNGKPISVSKSVDIPRSAENFAFFSEIIHEFKRVLPASWKKETKKGGWTLSQPLISKRDLGFRVNFHFAV